MVFPLIRLWTGTHISVTRFLALCCCINSVLSNVTLRFQIYDFRSFCVAIMTGGIHFLAPVLIYWEIFYCFHDGDDTQGFERLESCLSYSHISPRSIEDPSINFLLDAAGLSRICLDFCFHYKDKLIKSSSILF